MLSHYLFSLEIVSKCYDRDGYAIYLSLSLALSLSLSLSCTHTCQFKTNTVKNVSGNKPKTYQNHYINENELSLITHTLWMNIWTIDYILF